MNEWVQKQDPHIHCLKETHFRSRSHEDKVREWFKTFRVYRNQKKAGVATVMSDKIDFKIKTSTRDKAAYYINDQGINPRRRESNCKYIHALIGYTVGHIGTQCGK